MTLDNIRLVNTGNLTTGTSSTLVLNNGAAIVNRASAYLAGRTTIKDGGLSTGHPVPELTNDYGASLKMKDSAAVNILVVFNNSGTVTVPTTTNLFITAGSASSSSTMNINGTLSLRGGSRGAFTVQSGARLGVKGNLTLQNSTLYLPAHLGVASFWGVITIKENATIIWGAADAVTTATTPLSTLWIQNGGTFNPVTSTAKIKFLRMETGSVVDVDGGGVGVEKYLVWNGGTFTGQGLVTVETNATLTTKGIKYFSVSSLTLKL